ncbi:MULTISPECIES: PLP-dependent aminotransferase family protein [Streptomyces]|uniref:GntR family transcriptional regulator n=1 Tax=Streptomyces sviceus (strain ATCC 29083 / DSM 924 / JCM 4929 / NBRC 13980 / NCIMB 11184 / NRRL 5439 / UC 5370) TaxID=463191 RepID=D6XAM5_STRX2|nr:MULTISPECIES: PLP-dependent aminotransferase family protein [Streptomyces]EFH28824.1 GntR family transcriptional regulator [Streptomyces sviceus ATCC 29083]
MAKSWATSGIDLHLEPTGGGVRRGLTDALREAVRTGRLAPGTRLPSSRALAADLGIARNTVADAYADLVAEGWLTARQGSGTHVSDRTVVAPAGAAAPRPRTPGRPTHNLVPGTPDLASFPRAQWLKAARRALATAPYQALDYGDPRGRVELRTALSAYLARARGVRADPERIVVCAGFSHGLRLLGAVLRARGARTVAVESYGLDVHWNLLAAAGLRTVPLPFDERGTDPRELTDQDAVLLTPAHQFPMGATLHRDRRSAVVEWARRTGGLVVEDDYDGEFRYDRQPVGALQGLDPDHVVHAGTASKSLAPGLRLGWLVLPPGLMEEVLAAKGGIDACGSLDQLTLAEFLNSGAYDRHVRFRPAAVPALFATPSFAELARRVFSGPRHRDSRPVCTWCCASRRAASSRCCGRLLWQGLAVHGLHRYQHPEAVVEEREALVVGYGTPPDHAWAGALEALCAVLPE